jgi:preprotein translocase subunit Sss1
MISVNDNFYRDKKDAAIIKIDEDKLPAIKLGNSDSLRTGETIFVYGFPGTADFNLKNMLESTFSKGIIGAFKDSDNKDFKIIQTDAKVSRGSSGGPLLNNRGEVVGLITYQTGELDQAAGDNFAFAIPINSVTDIIKEGYIDGTEGESKEGDYSRHFRLGLIYLRNSECKKAIREFNYAVSKVNDKFEKGENVQNYLNQCSSIIKTNQSADTGWQKFIRQIKKTSLLIWALFSIGFLVFILLIVIFWHLSKKIKKDEKEINALEKQLDTDEKEIGKLEKIVVQVKEENSNNHDAQSQKNTQKPKQIERNRLPNRNLEEALNRIDKFGIVKFDDKK